MSILSSYHKVYATKDGDSFILYSTLTGGIAVVDRQMLLRVGASDITEEEHDALGEAGLLADDDDKQTAAGIIDRWDRDRRHLNAVAVVNLMCNLQCIYCYEGDRKNIGAVMSQSTADAFVQYLTSRLAGNDRVRIDFYGGEPLLSIPLIEDISRKMIAAVEGRGVGYEFSLVTNGTLLSEGVVRSLQALGLRSVKVTIDGPADIHNSQRPRINGNGSFDRIVENTIKASEIVGVQIGGNYGRDNYRRFPELLDYLLGQGLDPQKILAVKFDPITETESRYNKASAFEGGCKSITEPWLIQPSIYLRGEILKRGFTTLPVEPGPCMIYSDKEIVVNYDGSLYRCPGFLCNNDFCLGNISDQRTEKPAAYRLDLWKNERCLGCVYLPLCFGGCRYMKYVKTGEVGIDCRYDFFEATLGEYLRQDVKYRQG